MGLGCGPVEEEEGKRNAFPNQILVIVIRIRAVPEALPGSVDMVEELQSLVVGRGGTIERGKPHESDT